MATEIPLGFDGITPNEGTTSTSPADFTVEFTPAGDVDDAVADSSSPGPGGKEEGVQLLDMGGGAGKISPTLEEKVSRHCAGGL